MERESPDSRPDAAQIAREANAHIREMAEGLNALVPDGRPIGFFCECGCLEIATMTLADFEAAGGVWLDGHSPGPSGP